MKDKERIKGIVEAILFTMGESVALSRLAEVLEVEEDALKDLLEEMKGDYAGKDRGICLIELDGAYQICTKIETYEYVKKLVSQPKKRSLTEVLAARSCIWLGVICLTCPACIERRFFPRFVSSPVLIRFPR